MPVTTPAVIKQLKTTITLGYNLTMRNKISQNHFQIEILKCLK